MNSKYTLFFVMSLVIGSGFVVFINSDTEVEVTTVPETLHDVQLRFDVKSIRMDLVR